MTDRLSALDVSFLYLEGPTTPMHLGNLAVFELPAAGFDYERLVALVQERISLVPRYRQKVAWVPGHLANPVWIDAVDFDVAYHVRRSGLPKPGTDQQLREFCARIQSRALDRRHPLWELYLIEGLSDSRVAIASKTHYAMVDGITAIDLEQVILDAAPSARLGREPLWLPRPGPTSAELVVGAAADMVRRPTAALDAVRLRLTDLRASVGWAASIAGGMISAARTVLNPPRSSPLNATTGERRRFSVVRTPLADYRRVHTDLDVTVNDVVLATVAGALRGWLLLRGESVQQSSTVRAMVPVSVRTDDEAAPLSSEVSPMFVDLPVGEANPLMRLAQIGFSTRVHSESGQAVGAQALVALSGFAPPTLHAMAARAAGGLSRRLYNLVVTNVPGPQTPLYAGEARMLEIFPIVPLGPGQALAIGVTSYDGGVYYGLNADWAAMPDVEVLASLIEQSLAELVAAGELAGAGVVRAQPIATVTDVGSRRRSKAAGKAESSSTGPPPTTTTSRP
jgi:diacylglycerol O-acyltransferase